VACAIDSVTTICVLDRLWMLPLPINWLPRYTWSMAPLSNPAPVIVRVKLLAATEVGLM
jgi:hypothetical protein